MFDIGAEPEYDTFLFQKDCVTEISDITINSTETVGSPDVSTSLKTLTLGYSIDKFAIASSSIWNSTLNQIELCQVVQLKDGGLVLKEEVGFACKRNLFSELHPSPCIRLLPII